MSKKLIRAFIIFFIFFILSFRISNALTSPTKIPRTKLVYIPSRSKSLCSKAINDRVACHAKYTTLADGFTPLVGELPTATSLGPVQFHTAYSLPCTPGGFVQSVCPAPVKFGPEIIAVIDAFHAPTIENDLNVYSSYYGIPACTKANGCLTVVDQMGGTNYPFIVDPAWALETSLDVEVAHAICQTCKIVLVEAKSNSYLDLSVAVSTAASLGATAISNSYGGMEWSKEVNYDVYFNHPGIAITASSGDSGYGASYPASSPYVIGVGGTTLKLFSDNTYSSEIAWSGSGSGCSSYEKALPVQTLLPNWSQTKCAAKRAVADVSAVADPVTGAAVYDTTSYGGKKGWWQVGGTSLSSPIIAATFALAGKIPSNMQASSVLYSNYNTSNFHDIISGSNGFCGAPLCTARIGYDGPTGLGTPNGLLGFGYNGPILIPSITPTTSMTPNASVTPTITPTVTIPNSSPTVTVTPTPPAIATITIIPTLVSGDNQAPKIFLYSPKNNSTVRSDSTISIYASVSDTIGVSKVDYYVNGILIGTKNTSPYKISWKVPFDRNSIYLITVIAYDTSSNFSSVDISIMAR